MLGGEGVEGEQVFLGFCEQPGDLRQRLAQPFERVTDELARLLAAVGAEDRPEQRGQHRLLLAPRVPQRFTQEVDRTALPGAAEHLADRLLQPGVRIGDDQLHAAQAALDQRAQE